MTKKSSLVAVFVFASLALSVVFSAVQAQSTTPISLVKSLIHDYSQATFIARRVSQSADDAIQEAGGTVVLTDAELELLPQGDWQYGYAGLRFTNINAPQGAVITHAFLRFTASQSSSESAQLVFRAEATNSATPYSALAYNLTQRQYTPQSLDVQWTPGAWNQNQVYTTPNLAGLVQAVVNRAGWQPGNAVGFMVLGVGNKTAMAFDGDATKSAQLFIRYIVE